MNDPSPLSDDWKLNTYLLIKADHDRRGIPYYTNGPECEKRLREAHNGVQPVMKLGTVIGMSDVVTDAIEAEKVIALDKVNLG